MSPGHRSRFYVLGLFVAALALASTSVAYIDDVEPESYAQMVRMLAEANAPRAMRPRPPPPPPPPPPSPAWVKLEQQYETMLNTSCNKVLAAAPVITDTDASAFMSAYQSYNGTNPEDPVFNAAEQILKSDAMVSFLSAPDSFQTGGLDAAMVTCSVLTSATPAGLATFAVNSSANEALITQLLADTILMRDMLVAGGAKRDRNNVAQYGPAMSLYTQMLKESTVLDGYQGSYVGDAECTFKPGCDYGHGSREMAPATSQEECCTLCSTRSACAAGVFDGTSCWFKSSADVAGGCQKSSRVKAACIPPSVKPGPAPPPPTPPPPPPPPAPCSAFKSAQTCPVRCAWTKDGTCTNPPIPPEVANPWDSRNQSSVLKRLALGTAIAHSVAIDSKWDGGNGPIDAVARYLHYEKAYLDGDLDPAFEVLTSFEQSWVTAAQPPDNDLAWMRKTMNNYRPDHIVMDDYHWRYSESVHTEVSYGDPTWPDGRPDYKDIAAAGGVCGPRAWFGRFCKRSFGLPTWGAAQPGHAAMTSWAPEGWAVQLGATWHYCTWAGRGGSDFYLETRAREFRGEYQRVLRQMWVADARGDKPVSPMWNPYNPKSLGSGGLWNALALYAKKISVQFIHNNTAPVRPIGPSVVPTKVSTLMNRWKQPVVKPNVTTGPGGTIVIPAAAFTWENKSSISIVVSSDSGYQIMTGGVPDHSDPEAQSWWYEVEVDADKTAYLTANITTWHMQTTLSVQSLNVSTAQIPVPVYYTVGYWNQTQAVEVKLVKGKNILKFARGGSRELVIKEFFLYGTKPDIGPPPTNHTPSPPAPSPPVSDYIELPPNTDCERQGIQNLTPEECQDAAYYFGFKDTGTRQRAQMVGCFVIVSGQYKGNANFNANASATCCDPDARSVCIRK